LKQISKNGTFSVLRSVGGSWGFGVQVHGGGLGLGDRIWVWGRGLSLKWGFGFWGFEFGVWKTFNIHVPLLPTFPLAVPLLSVLFLPKILST